MVVLTFVVKVPPIQYQRRTTEGEMSKNGSMVSQKEKLNDLALGSMFQKVQCETRKTGNALLATKTRST